MRHLVNRCKISSIITFSLFHCVAFVKDLISAKRKQKMHIIHSFRMWQCKSFKNTFFFSICIIIIICWVLLFSIHLTVFSTMKLRSFFVTFVDSLTTTHFCMRSQCQHDIRKKVNVREVGCFRIHFHYLKCFKQTDKNRKTSVARKRFLPSSFFFWKR